MSCTKCADKKVVPCSNCVANPFWSHKYPVIGYCAQCDNTRIETCFICEETPDFCNESKDEDLQNYNSLEELLNAEFYPGNYNPTKAQAKQLIKCAVLSAIRWTERKKAQNG